MKTETQADCNGHIIILLWHQWFVIANNRVKTDKLTYEGVCVKLPKRLFEPDENIQNMTSKLLNLMQVYTGWSFIYVCYSWSFDQSLIVRHYSMFEIELYQLAYDITPNLNCDYDYIIIYLKLKVTFRLIFIRFNDLLSEI